MSKLRVVAALVGGVILGACQTTTGGSGGQEMRYTASAPNEWSFTYTSDWKMDAIGPVAMAGVKPGDMREYRFTLNAPPLGMGDQTIVDETGTKRPLFRARHMYDVAFCKMTWFNAPFPAGDDMVKGIAVGAAERLPGVQETGQALTPVMVPLQLPEGSRLTRAAVVDFDYVWPGSATAQDAEYLRKWSAAASLIETESAFAFLECVGHVEFVGPFTVLAITIAGSLDKT